MTDAAAQAATVLLLRDGAPGLEVYLLRRTQGHAVRRRDDRLSRRRRRPARRRHRDRLGRARRPTQWAAAFGCDERTARELVCAAVRETFEEAGVLLAGARDGGPGAVVPDVSGDDWEEQRQALLSRELSLAELLAGRGLALRSDLLRPFAHWITPPVEPRRYDTKFFAAALPVGQEARRRLGRGRRGRVADAGGRAGRDDGRHPADAAADDPHPRPARAVRRRRRGAGRLAAGAAAADQPDVRPRTPDGRWAVLPDGTRIRLVVPIPVTCIDLRSRTAARSRPGLR